MTCQSACQMLDFVGCQQARGSLGVHGGEPIGSFNDQVRKVVSR